MRIKWAGALDHEKLTELVMFNDEDSFGKFVNHIVVGEAVVDGVVPVHGDGFRCVVGVGGDDFNMDAKEPINEDVGGEAPAGFVGEVPKEGAPVVKRFGWERWNRSIVLD